MTKEQAKQILHKNMQNVNLRRHCYAVSFAMGGIYDSLAGANMLEADSPSKEVWEILGLLHDADYELTKDDWTKHTLLTLDWLKNTGVGEGDPLYLAVQSHNNKVTKLREVQTQMEWALECCDELTGFIVAVTLVQPDKELSSVDINSILKKWKTKAFARAVERTQIEQCEKKLGIKLDGFIGIVLKSMQENALELGL